MQTNSAAETFWILVFRNATHRRLDFGFRFSQPGWHCCGHEDWRTQIPRWSRRWSAIVWMTWLDLHSSIHTQFECAPPFPILRLHNTWTAPSEVSCGLLFPEWESQRDWIFSLHLKIIIHLWRLTRRNVLECNNVMRGDEYASQSSAPRERGAGVVSEVFFSEY